MAPLRHNGGEGGGLNCQVTSSRPQGEFLLFFPSNFPTEGTNGRRQEWMKMGTGGGWKERGDGRSAAAARN